MGHPWYGIKRPNHSLWIRQRIGLDQFSVTDSYEFGLTPNVPFFRFSLMEGDPYVNDDVKQKGTSYHGGVRGVSFAWHLNASGWNTKSDYHQIDMTAAGIGGNFWKTIFYFERNWRKVKSLTTSTAPTQLLLYPSSTITEYSLTFAQIPGLSLGLMKEEYVTDSVGSHRNSLFLDLHPIPGIQLEIWKRMERGARALDDALAIIHLYFDW